MKTAIALLLMLVIFMTLITQVEKIHSPELFGLEPATAVWFRLPRYEFGVIYAVWADTGDQFIFLAAGKDGAGYVVQLTGPRMGQYGPYEHSSEWAFYYERQIADPWKGRIEFRGKLRAFCGGRELPEVCRWR